MTLLDDLAVEIRKYAESYALIEIIDVEMVDQGNVLNVNDEVMFKIKVNNTGPLDMTDVTLHLEGLHGATVRPGIGYNYAEEYTTTTPYTINGHVGEVVISQPYFKAPATKRENVINLVKVTIATYNLNWNHPMIDHTNGGDLPKGTYASTVEDL